MCVCVCVCVCVCLSGGVWVGLIGSDQIVENCNLFRLHLDYVVLPLGIAKLLDCIIPQLNIFEMYMIGTMF